MVFGIITAGGQGRRLARDTPKLEIEILGKPMVLYSLAAFQLAGSIDRIILTVPPERLSAWSVATLKAKGIDKMMATVAGGADRQDSVRHALEEIPEHRGAVVVHDGARPLVTPEMIDEVSSIPADANGVITAVKVTDTVKEVEADRVEGTFDRSRLMAVQTPQAFPLEVLRKAHRRALRDGFTGTDDASLVERIGGVVKVVEGSRENIKVTFPEDVNRVEAILIARRGC